MPAFVDLTARRFGRWTVEARAENNRHNQPQWHCICDCGGQKVVTGGILVSGASQSCGCLARENASERGRDSATHGMARSPTYRIWGDMLTRCTNPKSSGFRKYGARGVTVCDRWRRSFAAFLEDMGERPLGLTLDRIDNSKGYEPGNCRWATMQAQQNNRSNNHRMTHDGVTLTLAQWARRLRKSPTTLHNRLNAGLPLAEVLSPAKRSRWHST